MQKLLLGIIIICIGNATIAQKQLQITYQNFSYKKGNVKDAKVEVVCTNDICLSSDVDLWEKTTINGSSGKIENSMETIIDYTYKELKNNAIYTHDSHMRQIYILDKECVFDWKLKNETEEILGYRCNVAVAHFRGRDYIAWFTTNLPFKAAPWKFIGLPGTILKVKSKDGYVDMEAISLKITKGEIPKNPFKTKKYTEWSEYVELYKKYIEKAKKTYHSNAVKFGQEPRPLPPCPRKQVIVEENKISESNQESKR